MRSESFPVALCMQTADGNARDRPSWVLSIYGTPRPPVRAHPTPRSLVRAGTARGTPRAWGTPPPRRRGPAAARRRRRRSYPPEPGGTDEQARRDEEAIRRYRYLLRTAPPEAVEQAHAEAFAQLTPDQRRQVLGQLGEQRAGVRAGPDDDPRTLARMATRAEMRQPGFLERMFGGYGPGYGRRVRAGGYGGGIRVRRRDRHGGGMGMGGMLAGGLLASIAGSFIGTAIAEEMFDHNDYMASGFADGGDGATSTSTTTRSTPAASTTARRRLRLRRRRSATATTAPATRVRGPGRRRRTPSATSGTAAEISATSAAETSAAATGNALPFLTSRKIGSRKVGTCSRWMTSSNGRRSMDSIGPAGALAGSRAPRATRHCGPSGTPRMRRAASWS